MKNLLLATAVVALGLLAPPALGQVQGQWAPTGFLHTPREVDGQVLMSDGKVLATGGIDNSGNILASAELYTPTSASWALTGTMAAPRASFPAVAMANGEVLVEGGLTTGSQLLAAAELFNVTTGHWSAAGSLAVPRSHHSATVLANGKVLVAGGCATSTCSTLTTSAELYDPASNHWAPTGHLNVARAGHRAVLLKDGKVLVIGGTGGGTSTELYDPGTGTWSLAANTRVARVASAATLLPDGKVLMTGGASGRYPINSAELYNPTANTWTATGSMLHGRHDHSASLLPDGTVLVAGGEGQSISCGKACTGYIPTATAELFNESTGTFSAASPLERALAYHAATVLASGRLLVAGGVGYTATCCVVVPDSEDYTLLSLRISSYSLNFGFLQVKLTSPAQTVTVANVSNHAVSFSSIAATGDYSVSNTCPSSLSPGQDCSVSVKFSPKVAGTSTGAVTLTDNSPGSPTQTLALNGVGETLALGFSPGNVNFGSVIVGYGLTRAVTLINDSAATVTIKGVSVSGSGSTYREANNCPATLAAQQSCTVEVTFTPPDVGTYSATLSVANSAGAAAALALVGTGADN